MVVWRRFSGTADSKETIMIPRWLQDSLGRAKLSPRWPKLAPRWSQEGLQNYLARFTRCAAALFGPILGPSWAILGPLGPLLGGPGGHLEAKFGLGRLDLGVQGGQKLSFQKHQKTLGKSMFLAEFWRQRAFRKLAKWLFGGLLVGLKA